ncbi:Methyl-accepting chemotaxis protein I (serine chemoreceptor protein) [Candidatus Burkholderia verschuerenii]|uniref:Methyl-accepting chemotaxis protein I (Serine chemoreceptor protein) n=1 Tax=Candidatus Burkholderia verschuerenii TaxID=242163 RepID=A0A0L0MFS5_9BURK|nr:methyl-accepting chemotaxis protein [Candidatus Burkholderia verschuerenii]KND61151.1 Methyl-accepting chemotaxis protein I (serine chemoreceptor protein) [Candidatus Burkholderia verschuerenii]
MKKALTIKARLGITMAFLGALLIMTGTLGLFGMSRSNDAFLDTYSVQMPGAIAIGNAEMYAARERLVFDRAALLEGTGEVAATVERSRLMRSRADAYWKEYTSLPQRPEERALADAAQAKRLELQQIVDRGIAALSANDRTAIIGAAKAMQATYNELAQANEALRKVMTKSSRKAYEDAQSRFVWFRALSLSAITLGMAAAVFAWSALRRAIASPLEDALGHFDAIAAGDLRRDVVVTSNDEIGQLLNGLARMRASLMNTVGTVRSGSESIASATKQIAAGNTDLSSRTEEQASALQETASSMEQLTGTVRQNADNARQASALAANASEVADKGSNVVMQVVDTMGEINRSSSKIADIISIIEGIAFQTNILALNAAVEAARAGEEGRGFAVVAGEVRSLAQRSAAAAKEIKELIDTSVARVQTGTTLVDEAGRTMNEVIVAVQRVTDIMGEIAAASEEQSSGIEQVSRAVSQMDEVTQQNAALVEEAAAAAQSLEDQAGKLREAVAIFKTAEGATLASSLVSARPVLAARVAPTSVKPQKMQRAKAAASPAQPATKAAPAPAPKPAALATASASGDWETF